MDRVRAVLRELWIFRTTLVIFLTPIVLLPVPILYESPAGRCAYAILIMAVFWVTEAIPIAVTALLPVVLMPWFGVVGSKDLCMHYLKDGNMLFVGGLIVAVAVEKWNLHKRIALRVMLIVGSEPKWLMCGFMLVTAFLSMWISNTATTAMMVPIAQAVLVALEGKSGINERKKSLRHSVSLRRQSSAGAVDIPEEKLAMMRKEADYEENPKKAMEDLARLYDEDGHAIEEEADENEAVDGVKPSPETVVLMQDAGDRSSPAKEAETAMDGQSGHGGRTRTISTASSGKRAAAKEAYDKKMEDLGKALSLSVAYAANIGGTATLTGSPTNIVLKGQVTTIYKTSAGVSFTSWFIISFPNTCISLVLAWLWLQILYFGPRSMIPRILCCKGKKDQGDPGAAAAASVVIRREYAKLGPMTFAEVAVLIHFIILAVMWITREPEFVPGYSYFLQPGYVTDACVAISVSISLFICPSIRPNFFCCRKKGDTSPAKPVPALLNWKDIHQGMSWSVVILLGGGFALAEACKKSGLSKDIGGAFGAFADIPTWGLVFILCCITGTVTQFTSNVATCTIFIPILAELANNLEVNPLYLIIPVTISTSLAFVLPVATPPNAIVFAYGRVQIIDMVKAGVVMNVLCLLVLQVCINTWGYAYFNLGEYPDWARGPGGVTSAPPADVITYAVNNTL